MSNGNDQSKTSGDTDKPSVPKTFDSDDGDGFDSVSPKKGILTYLFVIIS